MPIVPGTPAVNPPVPGDPRSLADTTSSTETFDVVINGIGYMLYRDRDDSPPSENYSGESVDYSFSPVFLDRTNVQGDLGDNTQDFYMTFVQRDWSGGIGQKFFRQQDDRERSFWDAKNLDCSSTPGSVKVAGIGQTDGGPTSAGVGGWFNLRYFKSSGGSTVAFPPEGVVSFEGSGSVTVVYKYSTDAYSSTTTQTVSAATIWTDCVDMCVGDDGNVYCLEGVSGGATSTIHKIALPNNNAAALAWDNSTKITAKPCSTIAYYAGNVYVGDTGARLKQVAIGTSSTQTIIHDFGGGKIVDMLSTPRGLVILYVTPQGEYHIYRYDGSATTELAKLPQGWHLQAAHESFTDNAGSGVGIVNTVHCMVETDGVLYVSGMTPTRDYVQSDRGLNKFRQSLWFYASGNSGIIWSSEIVTNHHARALGSPICSVRNGAIVWADAADLRMMLYDPATGGVCSIGTYRHDYQSLSPVGVEQVNGTIGATATSLVVSTTSGAGVKPPIGSIISCPQNTTELALVTALGAGLNGTPWTISRGYQGTTPSALSFTNGTTLTVSVPSPPPHAFIYDPSTNFILSAFNPTTPVGWDGADTQWANRYSKWEMGKGPDVGSQFNTGVMCSSAFDFNSSLSKYFRSVMIDGETVQFPARADEQAGTFDIYYKLNGVASATTDTGVVLARANATPGTFYDLNVTGRSISILVVLNPVPTDASHPISLGPVLTRVAVRGVPIQPGFRKRHYALALVNRPLLKDKLKTDPVTPAVKRKGLETDIQANTPVTVLDNTGSITMVFLPEQCRIREISEDEYIAYVTLREV